MPALVVFRFEKSIIQRNRINPLHIWILQKFGINVKENRHIHRLASIQPLLLEAETLNLTEIRRHLTRCHAVCCHANYILLLAQIRCGVKCQRRLTGQYPHFALLWGEFPWQDIGCGSREGDAQTAGGGDGGQLRSDGFFRAISPAVDGGLYGLPTPAGLLANGLVEWDGGVGEGKCDEGNGYAVVELIRVLLLGCAA